MRARPVGAATAAPVPCTARATISVMPSVARPHTSDAMVNTPTPERNARLWPIASPTRPPSSSSPPNVSTYAVMTQLLLDVGEIQLGLHARQRDDDDGAVERRHQLHAGDRDDRDAEHATTTAAWRCGPSTPKTTRRRHGLPAYPASDFRRDR